MPKIPKIIHQIWLNDKEGLPTQYVPYISSVISNHSDWEYILWDLDKVNSIGFNTPDRFNELSTWAHRSDILRYEIIHRFGGVYMDCDFQIIQPIDSILDLDEVVEKGAFLCNEDEHIDDYMSIGIFGATPGHEIFGAATSRALTMNFDHARNLYTNPTGPMFFRKSIRLDRAHVLPTRMFYPISYLEGGPDKNGAVFGIHQWAYQWGHIQD